MMKVKITTNVKKLFSCPEFAANHVKGKLPPVAGREITIKLPGRPSNFCNATIWQVAPEDSKALDRKQRSDMFVCEHQIEFLNKTDESTAKTFVVGKDSK